jgi:hypothetical protein
MLLQKPNSTAAPIDLGLLGALPGNTILLVASFELNILLLALEPAWLRN